MKNEAMWLALAVMVTALAVVGGCAGDAMYRKHVMLEMVRGGADPVAVACAMGSGSDGGNMAEAGNACIVAAARGALTHEQQKVEP